MATRHVSPNYCTSFSAGLPVLCPSATDFGSLLLVSALFLNRSLYHAISGVSVRRFRLFWTLSCSMHSATNNYLFLYSLANYKRTAVDS